ncbi:hypothetical protein [Phyllobacterium endophyticum]|uniref:hypothetical protein n=1 Tax=Phyllobacterium endophyticum TaxID=1149773 RepID=UPI0011C9660D|nr:hypothetical protein [Phyllobacterium endophyticum]TXR46292.1 hypothetical protein FVA77_25845 [Phyllobacterium endophyticum]
MPWKVRFRNKDFIGDEGWDPEFEFEVREALTNTRELSGSAEIIIHLKDKSVDDVTVHESTDPDEFPFNGVHGFHPELEEVFLFSGVPDDGEGQLIALYSAKDFGVPPYNDECFTGDGS